jgi:hypothetical protein
LVFTLNGLMLSEYLGLASVFSDRGDRRDLFQIPSVEQVSEDFCGSQAYVLGGHVGRLVRRGGNESSSGQVIGFPEESS